jgi:glycosyltransferase involved in cell wall biosynthesis
MFVMLDFYLLIPCFNNTEGLVRSLLSVEYPKEKYKVLVVDDGSDVAVDRSVFPDALLERQEIEIVRLKENKGITYALNTGLKYILAKKDALFTARLDCGDTCSPDRFYKQIEFLSVNTYVDLIGSNCLFVDRKKNEQYQYIAKQYHKDILREMHWKCSFIHPTVVFRNSALAETNLYPTTFPYAEDYALFFELVKTRETHILQGFHVETEINHEGISVKKRQQQIRSKINIIRTYGVSKLLILAGISRQYFISLFPVRWLSSLKKIWFADKKILTTTIL